MIFLVEDNPGIRETIVAYLELAGLEVREFARVDGVLEALDFLVPGLVILDVMLPDGNGFALARKLRQACPALPFLFLTARESESDRITGLELGAEDYIVKPFSPREMVLRVQAILRRTALARPGAGSGSALAGVPGAPGQAGGSPRAGLPRQWNLAGRRLVLDPEAHTASLDGESLHLTAAEWNILSLLAGHAGTVVSRDRLLGEGLEYLHDGSQRTINTHIKNLRAKLSAPGAIATPGAIGGAGTPVEWIETVRGFGYKFLGKP